MKARRALVKARWQTYLSGLPACPNTVSQSFTTGRWPSWRLGLSDRLRERPDAQQEFGIMLPTKVGLFLEMLVIGELGAQITGK